jgi:hypothetical protein
VEQGNRSCPSSRRLPVGGERRWGNIYFYAIEFYSSIKKDKIMPLQENGWNLRSSYYVK